MFYSHFISCMLFYFALPLILFYLFLVEMMAPLIGGVISFKTFWSKCINIEMYVDCYQKVKSKIVVFFIFIFLCHLALIYWCGL